MDARERAEMLAVKLIQKNWLEKMLGRDIGILADAFEAHAKEARESARKEAAKVIKDECCGEGGQEDGACCVFCGLAKDILNRE